MTATKRHLTCQPVSMSAVLHMLAALDTKRQAYDSYKHSPPRYRRIAGSGPFGREYGCAHLTSCYWIQSGLQAATAQSSCRSRLPVNVGVDLDDREHMEGPTKRALARRMPTNYSSRKRLSAGTMRRDERPCQVVDGGGEINRSCWPSKSARRRHGDMLV
jgi:hypothetical protein